MFVLILIPFLCWTWNCTCLRELNQNVDNFKATNVKDGLKPVFFIMVTLSPWWQICLVTEQAHWPSTPDCPKIWYNLSYHLKFPVQQVKGIEIRPEYFFTQEYKLVCVYFFINFHYYWNWRHMISKFRKLSILIEAISHQNDIYKVKFCHQP